jgi:hypothetical protein
VAQRSLFRTLIDSPWWVSVLAAVPTYAVGALLSRLFPGDANPHVLGIAASLPFLGVAVYTGWLRIRRGPSIDAPSLLKALRIASPEDMRAMLAEAYGSARYEIADGTSGDLELQRNGYLPLVRYRRWRAQSTGPAAVDELRAVMRTRKADHGVYVTAGTVTESARKRAAEADITFVDGFTLADLVGRTRGARAVLKRSSSERATT